MHECMNSDYLNKTWGAHNLIIKEEIVTSNVVYFWNPRACWVFKGGERGKPRPEAEKALCLGESCNKSWKRFNCQSIYPSAMKQRKWLGNPFPFHPPSLSFHIISVMSQSSTMKYVPLFFASLHNNSYSAHGPCLCMNSCYKGKKVFGHGVLNLLCFSKFG